MRSEQSKLRRSLFRRTGTGQVETSSVPSTRQTVAGRSSFGGIPGAEMIICWSRLMARDTLRTAMLDSEQPNPACAVDAPVASCFTSHVRSGTPPTSIVAHRSICNMITSRILGEACLTERRNGLGHFWNARADRSEEHTSEL